MAARVCSLANSGAQSVFGRDAVAVVPETRLSRASDRIEVEKRGTGRVWYTRTPN